MELTVVIIDDEERSRRVLKTLLTNFFDNITIKAESSNLLDGIKEINEHKPNLVFLDIEMPKNKGVEIYNFLSREIDFELIFTTAYTDYAVDAFELNAVDYLLKPISIERLEMSVLKVRERLELKKNSSNNIPSKISIPERSKEVIFELKDIIYFKANGSYTDLMLVNNKNYTASKKIKFFEDKLLNVKTFIRPHRSFIINLDKIEELKKGLNEIVMKNGDIIKISREMRSSIFEEINKYIKKT